MTDVTEKRAPDAAAQPVVIAETTASKAPGNTKKGTIIAVTALVVAAGASIGAYSAWLQLSQRQAALEQRVSSEEQALTGLQSTSESVRNNAQSLQQQLTALEARATEMKQHESELDQRLAEINQRLEERRGNDWLVAEARHLIAIASYQAQLNYNIKAALSALESADQRLREADDPTLLKARQALSNDITALRDIATIDTPGIALVLNQLERQVATLPLASDAEQTTPAATDSSATAAEPSALERFFLKVWGDIKGLVTIRHHSGPKGSPLMTPDQRIYLQQNLRLKLEVARLALLQRDTQTFRDTLATTRQWLERYFDTQAPATAAMLTRLAPFATLELQPVLPDIGSALRALDGWQEQRKGRTKVEAPLKSPLKRESSAS